MNHLQSPRLRGPLLSACITILAGLLAACGDTQEAPISGVLITLDTTNKTALGLYGNQPVISPHLDALARESVVYENARSVAPLTLPAHASMLTGLYPIRHTVRDNGFNPLPESAETLAERASARGFQTAAFVAAIVLAAPFGLGQGFDRYDTPDFEESVGRIYIRERRAEAMTEAALSWLANRDRTRPFFLWVHYFDPHAPYNSDPEFFDRVAPHTHAAVTAYLAEVAQADASIGRLLEGLRTEGLLDQALLAVVADHGESLQRHGEPTHSIFVYDATMRVPFLLRYPDGYRAGERSDEQVSITDLFPTFISALRLGEPGPVDGLDLFKRSVPPGRGVYFESYAGFMSYGWSPLSGWSDQRGTYIHGARPRLFLSNDPGQAFDLIDSERELSGEYRAQISRLADRPRLSKASESVDAEFATDLLALGYMGGADSDVQLPHPLNVDQYQDPSDHLPELRAFYQAAIRAGKGELDEAARGMRELIESFPENRLAVEILARILFEQGHFQEVVDLLQLRVNQGADRQSSQRLLANALEQTGQLQPSLEYYVRGYTLWPQEAEFARGAARVLKSLGREEEAQSVLRRIEDSNN